MLDVTVRKQFDGFRLDVAFAVGQGTTVLFGPSGSGKSLTLQTIAGIARPQAGRIVIHNQPVYDSLLGIDLPPQQRQVGYVPQHYALFPHLTLAKNIRFGVLDLSRREQEQRVREMIELCGLHGLEQRYPRELSGGQQQRVALARALAVRPQLLLLDEPFAALDAPLRAGLRQELVQLQTRLDLSIVLVTHDLGDAFALGRQLLVYDQGRVIQQGTRDEVFFRPVTRRVAEFVGTGNILPALVERAEEDTLWLRWQGRTLAVAPLALASGTAVDLCIRPTQILIVPSDRMAERTRENLFSGCIINEVMEAETYTLFFRVDGSAADYDLVISLPGYVYHRLSLGTEKQVTVELRRRAVHVITRTVGQEQTR